MDVRFFEPGVFLGKSGRLLGYGFKERREATPLLLHLPAGGCSALPSSSGWGSVMDK